MRYDPKQVFTSPAGPASFPNLTKPRQFKNKGDFHYDTGLILASKVFESEKIRGTDMSFAELFAFWATATVEKHRTEPRGLPVGPLLEKDADGNRLPVDGFTVVKFKVDAVTETKRGEPWDRKPKLFDVNGNPITDPSVTITGGTIIRVKFQTWLTNGGDPKRCGVKLQPISVQIVKAVENSESFERYEGGDDTESFEPANDTFGATPKGDF